MFLLINRPVLCMLIQLSRCYDDHSTHHSTGQVHFAKKFRWQQSAADHPASAEALPG